MSEISTEFMYNVVVEGKGQANQVFDSADEALRYAMHFTYLPFSNLGTATAMLKQGQEVSYSYGFSSVHIVPVSKRKLSKGQP